MVYIKPGSGKLKEVEFDIFFLHYLGKGYTDKIHQYPNFLRSISLIPFALIMTQLSLWFLYQSSAVTSPQRATVFLTTMLQYKINFFLNEEKIVNGTISENSMKKKIKIVRIGNRVRKKKKKKYKPIKE